MFFAPIVIIWLLLNFCFGVFVISPFFLWTFTINLTESLQNLARHDASVLRAFNPYYAGDYLVRNRTDGWKSLGGILLAFTGVEALFADLGAFSRRSEPILGHLNL